MTREDDEATSGGAQDEAVTVDIYLRGGQTVTLSVLTWKLTKTSRLTSLSLGHADSARVPYIALDDVVAVVERPRTDGVGAS